MISANNRSSIPEERLRALQQLGTVYVITCHQEEYFCRDHYDGKCRRGFFSLFLQAAYGIYFAKKLNIPYYIDFGNLHHSYSDEKAFQGNSNFWEYFFFQATPPKSVKKIINTRFENFPLRIWNKAFICKLHQAILEIRHNKEILIHLEKIKKQFEGLKILGIHIRKTDHPDEVAPVNNETYFNRVSKQIDDFDKLFIATDDKEILAEFKCRYPQKLMSHPFSRSSGTVSLHVNPSPEGGYELGKEALLDCYSLSFCDQAILSPSNLSYCALLLNPDLPYQLLESNEARWTRWKTLTAYHFDKWGIRKW